MHTHAHHSTHVRMGIYQRQKEALNIANATELHLDLPPSVALQDSTYFRVPKWQQPIHE